LNRMDNNGEAYATVLIIDGTRVGDVRVYEDQIAPTVISRYGTGGGNVPMVFPIQDGRDMEKNQNGLGVGAEDAPSYTLDRTGGQAVAYSIREDAKANNFSATETEVSLALQAHQPSVQSHHAQLFIAQEEPLAYDEYNDSVSDVHHTLRAGTKQSTGVLTSTVRRLTPVECERLQGFPDNWTDEQADSHRYKQMGNAVAVPVVEWIIGRLVNAVESIEDKVEQ
jgi:DNA (cytosine-5)-methyltransferase 1